MTDMACDKQKQKETTQFRRIERALFYLKWYLTVIKCGAACDI